MSGKKIEDMIGSIKEIAGSHSDEEIHAMLRDCSMDPNEAAQRLLEQDPFHEVRRKRDKKKEVTSSSDSSSSKWRGGSRAIQPKPKNDGLKHSPSSPHPTTRRRITNGLPTAPIPPLLHETSSSSSSSSPTLQLPIAAASPHKVAVAVAPTKEWKPKTTNPLPPPTTISQQTSHVIIPHHLQVPQAQRSAFSFGSFDATFGLSQVESPQGDYPHSPNTLPDTSSPHVSSAAGREYEQPRQDIAAPQYSLVHTAPNYNFGFMPPILGPQFAPFHTSDPQPRDASRLPTFVVQQAFDPSASYYTQFYRATGEGDGRFPAANKYNGGVSVESTATSSTTPPAAVMQQSQQLAVFRQPHLAPPHYPPNYIPYSSQYFSPQFYMPPPQTIHHYLTTNPAAAAAAFQQPSVYPPPPPSAAAGVKFSISPQFKPPATTTSTTTAASGNEELSSNYNKEYITGGQQQQQQASEGSGVWIPGRDIYPSSFYSLSPHQGQHVTFAAAPPTAAFYHQTAQSQQSGVEMYQQQQQQPQRAQLNWTANY